MKCCTGDTSDLAKQIGIGPTLFLMSTKALAWFFLAISILNIPVLMFYYKGNNDSSASQAVDGIFAKLSLGNVG